MCPKQNNKHKQIKIQGIYRKRKKQERGDKLEIDKEKSNIGVFIVFISIGIILLIWNAIFDL